MVDESLPIDVQHLMGAIEKHGCHEQQFFVIVFFFWSCRYIPLLTIRIGLLSGEILLQVTNAILKNGLELISTRKKNGTLRDREKP